ncbi:hypothetical protein KBW71_03550 [Hydrogenophaga aromaticivorans]|uniref:hypothetical protein n=1 Tax=Hydrogenophaga aromaticivorans TaxID=2610898 RepID=UPI001B395DC1|nr:hypothetical protein [Hydrogenophaga aromaticivorans]MBQ0917505.1 hypothetical protein [Hydrogenophaga aromaticivorans]
MNMALDFEQIENAFPEGMTMNNATGALEVSAQWLHDFARAIEAAAVAPPKAVPLTDEQIDKAAKVLSHCMDYPWEHMPEAGRLNMRKNAKTVIEAAHGITPATVEKG